MDSVGVVIPTRNSMPYLPTWLEKMGHWQDLVDEIVAVDSFSTDGTAEMLRNRLRHPRVRFISHPPGLYESWNCALQRLNTKYVYIATVADTITRQGLL